MREKLMTICENVLEAFWKFVFIAWIAYMTVVGIGLWTHLHRYAMEALK